MKHIIDKIKKKYNPNIHPIYKEILEGMGYDSTNEGSQGMTCSAKVSFISGCKLTPAIVREEGGDVDSSIQRRFEERTADVMDHLYGHMTESILEATVWLGELKHGDQIPAEEDIKIIERIVGDLEQLLTFREALTDDGQTVEE